MGPSSATTQGWQQSMTRTRYGWIHVTPIWPSAQALVRLGYHPRFVRLPNLMVLRLTTKTSLRRLKACLHHSGSTTFREWATLQGRSHSALNVVGADKRLTFDQPRGSLLGSDPL